MVLLVDEELVVLKGFSFGLNEIGFFLVESFGILLSLGQSILFELFGFLDLLGLGFGGLLSHLGDLGSLLKDTAWNISTFDHLVYKK